MCTAHNLKKYCDIRHLIFSVFYTLSGWKNWLPVFFLSILIEFSNITHYFSIVAVQWKEWSTDHSSFFDESVIQALISRRSFVLLDTTQRVVDNIQCISHLCYFFLDF